jgi:protein associated with RNAse G/E
MNGKQKCSTPRIYYRKEKLRGACWEYQVTGGWMEVSTPEGTRNLLHHRFDFYRAREVEVRTPDGIERMYRTGAEQWFFPDRWFSLLRFTTAEDRTVGYYVNFSRPLAELRENYYRDLDLELDLWIEPDGTATELDRDEFAAEVAAERLTLEWADAVNQACEAVAEAVNASLSRLGPDIELDRDPETGIPGFILRA